MFGHSTTIADSAEIQIAATHSSTPCAAPSQFPKYRSQETENPLRARSLSLNENSIDIWHCRFEDFTDENIDACLSTIDGEELSRFHQSANSTTRLHFLVGRALARQALSRYRATSPHSWRFSKTLHGRPEIEWPVLPPPIYFNISHTAGFAAVAISRFPEIGIDVELIDRDVEVQDVARVVFTTVELERILRTLSNDHIRTRRRFFDLWTLKEAYIKARGLGFSLPPRSFELSNVEGTIALNCSPLCDSDPGRWQFRLFQHFPGLRMAVAAGSRSELLIRHFEWKPMRA